MLLDFLINTLAVFRLSRLVSKEDGPFNVFTRVRMFFLKRAHVNETYQTIADGLHCPFCLSVWFSFIILLVPKTIRYAFGIAGMVTLLETAIEKLEGEI